MKTTKSFSGMAPLFVVSMILLAGTGQGQSTHNDDFELVPTIAFSSVRNGPPCLASFPVRLQPLIAEIYLMGPDGNVQQLTDNNDCTHFDLFAALSGDGKKIVFESNRLRSATDPLNTSDLFVMEPDGSNQTWLIRGSSPSWSSVSQTGSSRVSRQIVFHASASGTSVPIRPDPGAPTFDSDLFTLNVDDCLQYLAVNPGANCRDLAADITKDLEPDPTSAPNYNDGQFSPPNPPAIEEDADWSPDGSQIIFTSHPVYNSGTQIYAIKADGTGLTQLTFNGYEERAPAWSPDGKHIAYMCGIGPVNAQGLPTFEICVMPAGGEGDGTMVARLTSNSVLDATPSWSLDNTEIVFHRNPPPFQLWKVKADNFCTQNPDGSLNCNNCKEKYPNGLCETQLTNTPGLMNGFPHWGELRVHIPKQ
jgi:WD40-like Beta Propeller Repeat